MPSKTVRVKNNWKNLQSKNRTKKKARLALIVLGFLLGLLLVSLAIRFTQSLFSPIKTSYKRNYSWDGKFNINLLIRSQDISLLSYNPAVSSMTIIKIPDETFLEVPHGFGLWQLRAVHGLGKDKLLVEALISFLAVPVDGFLDFSSLNQPSSQIIKTLKNDPFSGFSLFADLKTNLSVWELIRLKLRLSGVRFDKINEPDLIKLKILEQAYLSDNTLVFTLDPVKADTLLSSLADPQITAERKSIAVLNATKHPQLARKWTRLVTNLGGNVIITANSSKNLEKTQVVGENSATLQRLRQIFELDCQNNPKCDRINPQDDELINQRAQISILLGEDYFGR